MTIDRPWMASSLRWRLSLIAVRIPLLHIADPTAAAIHEAHLSAVDLPGTLCKLTPRGDLAPDALNSILKQSGLKK